MRKIHSSNSGSVEKCYWFKESFDIKKYEEYKNWYPTFNFKGETNYPYRDESWAYSEFRDQNFIMPTDKNFFMKRISINFKNVMPDMLKFIIQYGLFELLVGHKRLCAHGLKNSTNISFIYGSGGFNNPYLIKGNSVIEFKITLTLNKKILFDSIKNKNVDIYVFMTGYYQ